MPIEKTLGSLELAEPLKPGSVDIGERGETACSITGCLNI